VQNLIGRPTYSVLQVFLQNLIGKSSGLNTAHEDLVGSLGNSTSTRLFTHIVTMPVTVKIAGHEASIIPECGDWTPAGLLNSINQEFFRGDIIQSSFDGDEAHGVRPSHNGFVSSVTKAYNSHHHLIIRPDDVWIAIITQFNFYVNAHAEELRHIFVSHEGKKDLEIIYRRASRFDVDFADFAVRINDLLEENIVDAGLRKWITPSFSTTTQLDTVVASVIMMGTLKEYFNYSCMVICGIPSVTLLGTKHDYEEIMARLERLQKYGDEATEFSRLLRPILEGFVRTFEKSESNDWLSFWKTDDVHEFWKRICKHQGGCDNEPDKYTGWITAFCFWDERGRRRSPRGEEVIGGQAYPIIPKEDLPSGFVKVPVIINDHGSKIEAEMLAGSVGIVCSSSGRKSATPPYSVGLDTMQPRVGWFIYERLSEEGKRLTAWRREVPGNEAAVE
jgi:hypothetical protein